MARDEQVSISRIPHACMFEAAAPVTAVARPLLVLMESLRLGYTAEAQDYILLGLWGRPLIYRLAM